MKKKTVLTVILTALVVLSAAVLGVANVFRIDAVVVNAPMVSDAAKAEAEALQKELSETYQGTNTLFADKQAAEEVFAKYPYFRLTDFSKDFPNVLVIEATEDAEVYAVEAGEEYYILSESGTVLGVRENPANRADGAENILVSGVEVSGALGEKAVGTDGIEEILVLTKKMSELLGGVRSNLVSVQAVRHGSVTQLTLTMREGVTVYVIKPETFTLEKAEQLTQKYLSLSDAQRLTGSIVVTDDGSQTLVSYYQSQWQ